MAGMLGIIVESFFTKIGKKLSDYTELNLGRITDYDSTFESLKRNLRSLSAKAIDVEGEIKNVELSGKKKRKREVENWLEDVKKLEDEIGTLESEVQSEGFVVNFFGGGQAAEFKERVNQLIEQSRHFGELVLDVCDTGGEELLTTKLIGKGFEENLERIWNFLREGSVKSIGIYGMGGVGKTTLATHINNRLVATNHECVFWVTVSQDCSIRMLQDKIAHVIGLNISDENDEDKKAARLNKALSSLRKKTVLILDDVWKDISLKKVGDPLNVQGCRLIITTRLLQVCHQIGCQRVIPVKTLDIDEAWNLFSEKFGEDQITTLSPQVKEIAKFMVDLCDGLPLGIITLAGSMRGETDIYVWRNAHEELRKSVMEYDDMEDKVFKVLKYSFNRLDPKHQTRGQSNEEYTKLQQCFLYCCLYPEDYKIRRYELVRNFISEELVDKRKGWGAQFDEGHTILNKLVNVCLLESARKFFGVYDCVKMHDLVRAMAVKITQGKYKVLAGCRLKQFPSEEECWKKDIENIEKMSLMGNNIREIPDGMSPNCPKLTTLLLQYYDLVFISDSFFLQMHGLCVLNLSGNRNITKLPNSLSELRSLQTLLLGDCLELESMPCLGSLKELKELDLSNTAIKEVEVSQGMDELVNLKFLSLDNEYLKDLPKGFLLNFSYLQCLRLPFKVLVRVDEIEGLEQLEEFEGRLENVSNFNRWMRSTQQNQITFIKFNIKVGPFLNGIQVGPSFDDVNNLVLEVEENSISRVITVCEFNFSQDDLPIMLPDNVQHLRLEFCGGLSKCLLDDFSNFNNLKCLQYLVIEDCDEIECIMEKQEIGVGAVALPAPAQAVFSSLTKLDIALCPEMKKLGLTRSELPNIEEISIRECSKIEEIIEQGEGEADVVHFPKLISLHLYYLPRLKSICKARMKCDSIMDIDISGCEGLKRIPLYFQKEREAKGISFITSYSPPPALKRIQISLYEKEWWDSLEWEHPDHKGLLQPFVNNDSGSESD